MNIQETILGLESMLFDLHPKAKGLYDAIDALKNLEVSSKPEDGFKSENLARLTSGIKPYDPKLNMRAKALFAIRELNRFVKNKEIAELLHSYEPNVGVKEFISALSNPLYFLKNENRIHKFSLATGNSSVYWGSLKWLNEDGTIKKEHMYIEEPKEEQIEI